MNWNENKLSTCFLKQGFEDFLIFPPLKTRFSPAKIDFISPFFSKNQIWLKTRIIQSSFEKNWASGYYGLRFDGTMVTTITTVITITLLEKSSAF